METSKKEIFSNGKWWWMYNLKEIKPGIFELPKTGNMKVPGLIVATNQLMQEVDLQKPLEQVANVAQLPGIVGYSIAMPDIHWGYGFPIGGVAAMDAQEGVISPGGVGYDINCGVRLAYIEHPFSEFSEETKQALLKRVFELVPSGVGRGQTKVRGLSDQDYRNIAEKGMRWSIEEGFGLQNDLEHCESLGFIEGAGFDAVSSHAKDRGKNQLGSIGSGNHFVEIGSIDTIYQSHIAEAWNLQKGYTYILIHSGSRGFGHQVCQDYLDTFLEKDLAKRLPDKQLVCTPIQSDLGKQYFAGMAFAANFAFNNRQRILYEIREAFKEICNIAHDQIKLVYDVCHNIAKFEEHEVEGQKKKVCVHRKGATRAFGPHAEELAPIYKETGQPVLVPGDMGRASHILVGQGNPLTWKSCCHGAGRAKSRMQSMKSWRGQNLFDYMKQQNVSVMASSKRTIAEEMPDAYKDVDLVVDAVEKANLALKVCKLKPALVIKG